MKKFLIINLDNPLNGPVHVCDTYQEAEEWIDENDTREFRSNGFMIVPVEFTSDPVEIKVSEYVSNKDDDDDDVDSPFLSKLSQEMNDDKLGIKDELAELK